MTIEPKILEELKSALIREKDDLEKNLGRIAKPIDQKKGDYETSFEVIGTDKEDNATEVEEYSDNFPVEATLEKKLQNVIEALGKIEKGNYGICENCQQEISIERLKANPSAKTCTQCK